MKKPSKQEWKLFNWSTKLNKKLIFDKVSLSPIIPHESAFLFYRKLSCEMNLSRPLGKFFRVKMEVVLPVNQRQIVAQINIRPKLIMMMMMMTMMMKSPFTLNPVHVLDGKNDEKQLRNNSIDHIDF